MKFFIFYRILCLISLARAFVLPSAPSFLRSCVQCFQQTNEEQDTFSSISTWTDTDDWSRLSSVNNPLDGSDFYDQDRVGNAARHLEKTARKADVSPDDEWISTVVDQIHDAFATLEEDELLYDTSFDEPQTSEEPGDMSNEIAMLIRCNQHPEDLLISEGRALLPLSEQEKKNVFQLVAIEGESIRATDFLKESVSIMFRHHASKDDEGILYLDRIGVAKWMSQALKTEEGRVSAHDKRVLQTLSDFSTYGSGKLLEKNFHDLYWTTIVGPRRASTTISWKRHLQLRQPYVDAVWRDFKNHGILSPIEQERNDLVGKLTEITSAVKAPTPDTMIMDECEILDWDYSELKKVGTNPEDRKTASGTMNSHKLVERAPNTKAPVWMRDGQFIFIDEESCIGCMQCVNVSPDSFFMLENGRARTFNQRNTPDVKQAVTSCPVACMHSVTFTELEEYETARDEGDGKDDHRHLGHQRGHIPLHVAGMDSDVNRRSSWYHTLKERCLSSGQCPQKGCYDCPRFSKPGDNPFFQKHQKEMDHVRASYFIERGDIDAYRKTADL